MCKYRFVFTSLLLLCFTACSNTDTNSQENSQENTANVELNSTEKIFSILNDGGCMMAGPNCPRYVLQRNGEFSVYRGMDSTVSATAKIDQAVVQSWLDLVEQTDFQQLKSRLGEGECRACFDGVDHTYTVLPMSKNIVLNSREYEFAESEAFFQLSKQLMRSMASEAPLTIKSR